MQRHLVGSRRAAKSEIDAAREQALQGSELFGDDIRGMIGKHDAARADPDALRSGGDVRNHDRCRGAGDARHVVVLRDPYPPVAPILRLGRKVAGVVERPARVDLLGYTGELEDRQWRHRVVPEPRNAGASATVGISRRRKKPSFARLQRMRSHMGSSRSPRKAALEPGTRRAREPMGGARSIP